MQRTPRALRYPIRMSIRFRRTGDDAWLDGTTLDISESGVLFQTVDPVPPIGALVEMALELSSLGPRIADVTCTGRVVRAATAADLSTTMTAATIDSYSFARKAK